MKTTLFIAIITLLAQIADSVFVGYLFWLMWKYADASTPDLFLFATMAAGIWCISMSMNELKRQGRKKQ